MTWKAPEKPNDDLLDEVQQTLRELMLDGHPTLRELSSSLGYSVRTLQRRLADHANGPHLSYSQLLDQVRRKEACRLLSETSLKITDIAEKLGYSDPASFSRAFHRWTGGTPRGYREHQRRK